MFQYDFLFKCLNENIIKASNIITKKNINNYKKENKIMNYEEQIKELELQNEKTLNKIKELKELKDKSIKIPRAKLNDDYCYFDVYFNVDHDIDNYNSCDLESYESFNYFIDENEAKRYSEYIKLTIELFRTRDMINDGWKPDWNNDYQNKFCASFLQNKNGNIKTVNGLIFGSEEDMKKFIDIVGIDKIKKYIQF